jgi:hypothetical protein
MSKKLQKEAEKRLYWHQYGHRYNIRPNFTITTPLFDTNIQPKRHKLLSNIRDNTHLSLHSQQRIKTAVNLLIWCSQWKNVYEKATKKSWKFKVAFWTLTLPSEQIHSDKVILKEVFEPFLRTMRRVYKMGEYIWKAETQDNGNLHFHLTTNIFVHYIKLRQEWNYHCEKLGYVTRSKIEDPNSTDVHTTKNIKNLGGYLCGYIGKKDEKIKNNYRSQQFISNRSNPKENFISTEQMAMMLMFLPHENGTVDNEGNPKYVTTESPYLKRIPNCKLWACSKNIEGEKGLYHWWDFDSKQVSSDVIFSLNDCKESYKDTDFCQIIYTNEKKFMNTPLGQEWNNYIDGIRKKGCQEKIYQVEEL